MNEILRNVNIGRPLGDYIYPTILPPSVKLDISIVAINEMRRDERVIHGYKQTLLDYKDDLQEHINTSQQGIQILYNKLVDYFLQEVNKYIRNKEASVVLVKSVFKSPEKIKDTDSKKLLQDLINIVNSTLNKKYSDMYKKVYDIFTKFVEVPAPSNSIVYVRTPVLHRGELIESEPAKNGKNSETPKTSEVFSMEGGDNTDLNELVKILNEDGFKHNGKKITKNYLAAYKLSRSVKQKAEELQPILHNIDLRAKNPTSFGVNLSNTTKLDEKLLLIIEQVQEAIIKYFKIIQALQNDIQIIDKTLAKIQSRMGKAIPPPSNAVNVDYKKITTPVLDTLKTDLDKYKKSLVTEKKPYAVSTVDLLHLKNRLYTIIEDVIDMSFLSPIFEYNIAKLANTFYEYIVRNKHIPIEESIDDLWQSLVEESLDIVKQYKKSKITVEEIQNIIFENVGFKISRGPALFVNLSNNNYKGPYNVSELIEKINELFKIKAQFDKGQKEEANRILKTLKNVNTVELEYVNKNIFNNTTRKIKNIAKEIDIRRSGATRIRNTKGNIRYGPTQQSNQPSQPWWKRIFTKKAAPKKGIVWRNTIQEDPSSIANIREIQKFEPTEAVLPHPTVSKTNVPKSILKPPTPTRKWWKFWGGRHKTRKVRK